MVVTLGWATTDGLNFLFAKQNVPAHESGVAFELLPCAQHSNRPL